MRKTLGLCLLVLLLNGAAVAGEMPNDTPAPPKATAIQEPTGGEMQTGETANGYMPNDATDNLTQTTLEVLAVLSSLF